MVGSEHILATDENDAVHAIKVVTIAVKNSKSFLTHSFELFKSLM